MNFHKHYDRVKGFLMWKPGMEGQELRELLNRGVPWWKFWRRFSLVGFYDFMWRLEDIGAVETTVLLKQDGLFRDRQYRWKGRP